MKAIIPFLIIFLIFSIQEAKTQTKPFEQEVNSLVEKYNKTTWQTGGAVFTGSSSIRMWSTLEKDFPKNAIINTGFGGSQTHELLEYLEELVINFSPSKVFIYEGDNDVNAGKSNNKILEEHHEIISKIKERLPETELYIISAKPSPSRWSLKDTYLQLNEEMRKFCSSQEQVTFIDVWTPMMDKTGNPNPKLFIEDNLHMNSKGYKIWKKAVKPHLK